MAHRTASTALPNSASTLSPAVLAMRPPWRRNQPVQDFPARGEGIECSDLIGSHEAAIALDVSRKDSSQPALRFNGLGQG